MAGASQFWTFSLAVYADAAVQKECLDLQDRFGVDVNLLLFCAFVGAAHGALLSEADVSNAAAAVGDWHRNIVTHLREVRRALKPFAAGPSTISASAEALRNSVKASELEAERIEQTLLEVWCSARLDRLPRAKPDKAVAANIQTLLARHEGEAGQPQMPGHLAAAALAVARSVSR
jgi:uncharacterized protein (TIGR02444 family)